MARILVDCHACACLLHVEDASCPFCAAPQRRTGAPLWLVASLIGGIGLADAACDEAGDPGPLRQREQFEVSSTGTGTGTGTSTSTSTGTTGDDSDSSGDGSTTMGPAETDTLGSSSESGTGVTTTAFDSSPDSAAYAGPDENSGSISDSATSDDGDEPTTSSTDNPDESGPTTGSAAGSSGVMAEPPSGKDGCACTSRARPSGGLLGLLGLLGLRRRGSRRGR